MSAVKPSLQMPPRLTTVDGQERRVGVELEMGGMPLEVLAQRAANYLGLSLHPDGRYEYLLSGDPAGDWHVELDFNLLKKMGREARDDDSLVKDLEGVAEQVIHWGAEQVVPLEVISPPIPLSRLDEVEGLIGDLHRAGALGTGSNLFYAFGLQFNPEVPDTRAEVLCDYLRAFLCLYDWLLKRAEVNFTRRLTAYVDPFPKAYIRKLMAADYQPDIGQLIDDYLLDNPTRNRALDMLPLFMELAPERVAAVTQDPLIKARPTFHYRLPNCQIDEPGWGLHNAWNEWVEVERLAEDKTRLQACCAAYLIHLEQPLVLPGQWCQQLEHEWVRAG